MRVRIIGPDGETIEGNVAAKRGRTLAVTVPGVAGYVEFRFILGDWLSETGHIISMDFCEQEPATRALLSGVSRPASFL